MLEDTRESSTTLLDLVLFPVVMPVKGFLFLLNEIRKMADREVNDEGLLQRKLIEAQVLYEIGELDDLTYRIQWENLSSRLQKIREEGARDDELG